MSTKNHFEGVVANITETLHKIDDNLTTATDTPEMLPVLLETINDELRSLRALIISSLDSTLHKRVQELESALQHECQAHEKTKTELAKADDKVSEIPSTLAGLRDQIGAKDKYLRSIRERLEEIDSVFKLEEGEYETGEVI